MPSYDNPSDPTREGQQEQGKEGSAELEQVQQQIQKLSSKVPSNLQTEFQELKDALNNLSTRWETAPGRGEAKRK